ncbi:MAG: hypothetical protein K2K66_02015 [Ruminococcus sp.]|nr:hypothetical protein [Ruminococcus sp.]
MKSKKRFIKIIGGIVLIIVLAFLAVQYRIMNVVEAENLVYSIHSQGWERYITYDMLSDDLQEIISEEEFSDTNPQNRFRMYQKLENMIIDTRPITKFDSSTHGYKTPYTEFYEIDGKKYDVNFRIDINNHFGKMEIRNFCCYIYEQD